MAHPPPFVTENRGAAARPRSSSTGPGGATSSSTTRRCSTSTTRGCPPRSSRRALRPLVEAAARRDAGPAHLRRRAAPRRRRGRRRRTTRTPGARATCPLPLLPLRAGPADDGVTIDVPVATLNRVDADDFSWQVPGLREELVDRADPQRCPSRCGSFVPAPNVRRATSWRRAAGRGAAARVAARALTRAIGGPAGDAWDWDPTGAGAPAAHLPGGRRAAAAALAEGKDLDALKAPLRPPVAAASLRGRGRVAERTGLHQWTVGHAADDVRAARRPATSVQRYPALVDEGASGRAAGARPADARRARHRLGVRRLLLLGARRRRALAGPASTTRPSWRWPRAAYPSVPGPARGLRRGRGRLARSRRRAARRGTRRLPQLLETVRPALTRVPTGSLVAEAEVLGAAGSCSSG